MPTTYIRKLSSGRGGWTEDSLKKAIKAVKEKEMGVNQAAKAFGVPKTTLKRRIKSQVFTKGPLGPSSVLGVENEKKIVAHIQKLQNRGFTPCRDSVRSMAFELAEKLKLPHTFNKETKRAGYDWLQSFLTRNPNLSVRKSEGVSVARARGMNRKCVDEYFKLLEKIINENGVAEKPGNIFNMDETGLQINNRPGEVVAIKGSKNVTSITSGEKGETISVLACCNGEGIFLPPFCIFKGKNLKHEFLDGMPPGANIRMSPKSAYVTSELFFDWLKNHFTPRKPMGKVLLLLDGHTSHTSCVEMLEFAENNEIILMSLPPHTTHWLQPLDRSFFKSLKANYYAACNSFMKNHPSRKISRLQFGNLLNTAWAKSAIIGNGVNGFKASGIIPLNPDAIPDYAYLLEEIEVTETGLTDKVVKQSSVNTCQDNGVDAQTNGVNNPASEVDQSAKEVGLFTPTKLLGEISPIPNIEVNKAKVLKRKSQNIATVLNSSENIAKIKKKKEEGREKEQKREERKKNLGKKDLDKRKKPKPHKRKTIRINQPSCSSDSEIDNLSMTGMFEDEEEYEDDWDENECVGCGESYNETKKKEDWLQCITCSRWLHEGCTRFEEKCDYCGKRKNI